MMAGVLRRSNPKNAVLLHSFFAVSNACCLIIAGLLISAGAEITVLWPTAGVAALWGFLPRSWRGLLAVCATIFLTRLIYFELIYDADQAAHFLGACAAVIGGPLIAPVTRWLDRMDPGGVLRLRSHKHSLVSKTVRPQQVYHFIVASMVMIGISKLLTLARFSVMGQPPSLNLYTAVVLRDLTGVFVLACIAVVVVAVRRQRTAVREWRRLIGVGVISVVLLWTIFRFGQDNPLAYLGLLPLYWSATRFPVPQAVTHALLTAGLVFMLSDAYGPGPLGANTDTYLEQPTAMELFTILCLWLSTVVATTVRQSDGFANELRSMTETIPDALLVVERDGSVIPVNSQASDVVVAHEGNHFGLRPLRTVDGEVITEEDRPSSKALAGHTVRKTLVEFDDRKEGEKRRIFSVSASPVKVAGDSEPPYALLVWHDTTSEILAMETLRHAHAEARLLFDDAPQGIATLDERGAILQANQSLAELVGLTPEQLTGHNLSEFSEEGDFQALIDDALENPGRIVRTDRGFLNGSGVERRVALSFRATSSHPSEANPVLVNMVDVTERHELLELIEHFANHDPLTGVMNRRVLENELRNLLESKPADSRTGAVLLIDLDDFKAVNDVLGHHVGDETLVEFATLLTQAVGPGDLVARLGGDEFVIVLPDADFELASALGNHIVESVQHHFEDRPDNSHRVTASAGIAMLHEAREQGIGPMLLADERLYAAKRTGRNRLATTDNDTAENDVKDSEHIKVSGSEVETILDGGALTLVLQPIQNIATGAIDFAEGLVRVTDHFTRINTASFVEAVEQAGLGARLDEWVLRHGIRLLGDIQRTNPDFRLSLNISAQSFGAPQILECVEAGVGAESIRPGTLILEVTENAPIADYELARNMQQRLRALGVAWAIDDFASGAAPFRSLRELTFEYMKVDGVFVEGANPFGADLGILRSFIGLAKELGMETVAEFVSDKDAMELVTQTGATYAQGYLIGHPLPPIEFKQLYLELGTVTDP